MTGPDFRKRQPKSVHVDHSIGGGHLCFRHSLRVGVRTDFAFFLISEPDEYIGMLTGLIFYRLVEGWQKRRAAPVVNDSIAFGDVIEMRTNDDGFAGTARQNANNIWELRPFHRLFGKMLLVATCLRKQLLERISALPVISLVLPQAALDDCARDRLVVDTLRDRVDASEGKPRDYRKKPETRAGNRIVHVQRIPPASEREPARARMGVQSLTRSTSRCGRLVHP